MNNKTQLAMNGGEKAINTPFPTRGSMGTEEKQAVDALFDEAIRTGNTIGYNGDQEKALCREFSEYMGGGYTDAVNSGTTALYVALRALDIKPFSEVIVPAITDPGGMMPIPLLGCIPAVADTEKNSYNTGADEIEELITPLTSAIIVAHIGGEPAKMDKILALAKKHGLPVIEDCSQSHHASINDKLVGSFGKVAVYSTMFGKHHNSGGQGGLIYTADEKLYWKILQAADRGKPFGMPQGSTNHMASLNFNSSEISSAINRIQLKKLPGFVEGRRGVVSMLKEAFKDISSIVVPNLYEGSNHSYWWWRLEVNTDAVSCDKDEYCRALIAEGVPMAASYRFALPHLMDWFKDRRVFPGSSFPWDSKEYKGSMKDRIFETPNAFDITDRCFNLTVYESWGRKEVDLLLSAFKKVDMAYGL